MLQVKKGDRVIIAGGYRRQPQEHTVDAVGTKWIAAGGNRYNRVNGYSDYGARLYTPEGYEKWKRDEAAGHKLRKLGIDVHYGSPLKGHEEALLEAALTIVPDMRAKVEDE